MHDLPHLPCSNIGPMELCMDMWINGVAFNKEIKTDLNLSMWKANQHVKQRLQLIYRYMEDQSKGITCETKKAKHKLGFLDNGLRTHIEAYIRKPNTCVRMHKACMRRVVQNPNQENSKHKTADTEQGRTQNGKSNTLTCF